MKLSDVKLLQKVILARAPPIEVAPIDPNGIPCWRGARGFQFAEHGSIGTVIGIFSEKVDVDTGHYYPVIRITNDNLGQIEVPPECLEPYISTKLLCPDYSKPIGTSDVGDIIYALKEDAPKERTWDKYYFTLFDHETNGTPIEVSRKQCEYLNLKYFLLDQYNYKMVEVENWYRSIGYTDDSIYDEHIEIHRLHDVGWKVCIRRSKKG